MARRFLHVKLHVKLQLLLTRVVWFLVAGRRSGRRLRNGSKRHERRRTGSQSQHDHATRYVHCRHLLFNLVLSSLDPIGGGFVFVGGDWLARSRGQSELGDVAFRRRRAGRRPHELLQLTRLAGGEDCFMANAPILWTSCTLGASRPQAPVPRPPPTPAAPANSSS